MQNMNKTQKCIFLCVATLFAFLIFITPGVFAQSSSSAEKDKSVRTRQYMELLNSVYSFILQNYVDEPDPEVLYEGAMKGMMDSLGDPHTTYMDMSQQRSISDTTVGNFGGVGLSITKAVTSTPEKPAFVEVASPIEGTPGWKAGILSGDLIYSIDGVVTSEITMDDVLLKLRGKVGTSVDLVIKRGKNMEFPVTLQRALIEVPTVKYTMIERNGEKTGYLRIIEFTPQTPDRVQEAIDFFISNSFKSLVIDLRNNPGGLVTSVEAVADKFIDNGPIVSTKGRYPEDVVTYYASTEKTTMPAGIPIVVLINRGSASASEILSGALKDYKLAFLIGQNTYGKGSVQQPVPLPFDDGIKLTIARYYSPSDTNIDKVGIPPDLECLFPELSEDEEKSYVDMMQEDVIGKYTQEHPEMTETEIQVFADQLTETYKLEPRLLRRLVRLSVNKTKADSLYDLDYDIQLVLALDTVVREDFKELLSSTKTLKQLSEEITQDEVNSDEVK